MVTDDAFEIRRRRVQRLEDRIAMEKRERLAREMALELGIDPDAVEDDDEI